MCGISGFYSLKADKDSGQRQAIARAMEDAIAHRGPDRAESWHDPQAPLTFVHRRLSIIDLSEGGAQPKESFSGRYVIITNGEIYNYLELQAELEAAGHQFKTRSDTEVMLTAFEHWGVNQAIQKFNGMFAFVLWDKKEKQLYFVRDRFGKKPLYVGWCGNDLVFGSELKTFHAHPDFSKEINRHVLALYMHYGYVHAPYCIFDNVWQVLPAGSVTLDVDDLKAGENLAEKMQVYWSLKDVVEVGRANISKKSEDELIGEFESKMEKAVQQRMLSDVPLGAFLSGGIDSSSVVALMQKKASGPVKTFSIGFDEADYNEADHAKKIAAHLGTDHQEFYVSEKEAMDVIPQLPDIYDEPFADSSQIPTYLVSKMARDQVTVALTGDGGDEILAGYDRHTKIAALWGSIGWMPHLLRQAVCGGFSVVPEGVYALLRSGNQTFGRQVRRSFKLMMLQNPESIYESLVSAWPKNSGVVLEAAMPEVPLQQEKYWPKDLGFAEQMIFGDLLSYRSNDLMVKTDRASMAVALEARAPLMDYELAEYCWRLPHDMKVRGGKGKWLLRQVLKKYVPEDLYERPKQGFSVPLNEWLKADLKVWGDDLLSDAALDRHGLLNKELIRKEWQNFQQDRGFQAVPKHLWSVLMFQAWYARWMT